ncbi:MAG: superoxide dismutase, Ni [Litorimonas sp.]
MLHSLLSSLDLPEADAHCDIPCGIYDARIVQYYAVSALRQIDILLGLKDKGLSDTAFAMQVARNTAKKEEMAEKCKHETRVIWGDFMKPKNQDDIAKGHELAHGIMLAGSAVKQDLHREDGEKLVDLANQFAEVFWASKGVKTKTVTTPYAPNVEVVEPDL